jgi:hypothetical protein
MNRKIITNPEQLEKLFDKNNVARILDIPARQIQSIAYNAKDQSAHVDFGEIITFPLPPGLTLKGERIVELQGMDIYFNAENNLCINSLYLVEFLEAPVSAFGSLAGNTLDFNEHNQLIRIRGLKDVYLPNGDCLKLQALHLFPDIQFQESFFENCFIEFVPGEKVQQLLGNQETLGVLCSYNMRFPEVFLKEAVPLQLFENTTFKVKSFIHDPILNTALYFFEEPVTTEDGVIVAAIMFKINNGAAEPIMGYPIDDIQLFNLSESSRLLNEQLRNRLGLAFQQAEAVKLDENWLRQHSGIAKENVENITQNPTNGDYFVEFNPGFNKVMPVVFKAEVSEYIYDQQGKLLGVHFGHPVTAEIKSLPGQPAIRAVVNGMSFNNGEYTLFLSEPVGRYAYLAVNSNRRLQNAFTTIFVDNNNVAILKDLHGKIYTRDKYSGILTPNNP